MVTKSDPIVSICCITYNHAPFIRQSIEGMLMQQGVNYEILIHDDCSTDGTTEIVKEYAAKYPDIIFPLYEEVNQYQNGKAGEIDFFNYKRARGKYIAYCEGDDYWTDPLKLQKQVEFMEKNPEYSVCFHKFITFDYSNKTFYSSNYPTEGDYDISAKMLICEPYNIAQPLTMMFRNSFFSFEWQKHYHYYMDTVENFHLLLAGKGRFLCFNGGQYNLQKGGVSSQMQDGVRAKVVLTTYIDMYKYTGKVFLRAKILNTALWSLDVCDKYGHVEEKRDVRKLLMNVPIIAFIVYMTRLKRQIKSHIFN